MTSHSAALLPQTASPASSAQQAALPRPPTAPTAGTAHSPTGTGTTATNSNMEPADPQQPGQQPFAQGILPPNRRPALAHNFNIGTPASLQGPRCYVDASTERNNNQTGNAPAGLGIFILN